MEYDFALATAARPSTAMKSKTFLIIDATSPFRVLRPVSGAARITQTHAWRTHCRCHLIPENRLRVSCSHNTVQK
jgi:hypothetical protein